jgi:tRNA(adenine34) deaminase
MTRMAPDSRGLEEEFMRLALLQAEKAAAAGEVPVGAIGVYRGAVIAEAHNLVEANQDATLHAEILVLRAAANQLGAWRLSELDLYVTLEPCPMCASASVLSRVRAIYFGAAEPRLGACGSLFDLVTHPELPHHPTVVGGILASECAELLQKFFRCRR